jgi:hypothetical protein
MAARNFASVKLTSAFIDEARKEAGIVNRSLGGQIEHWARLGKALESAPGFSMERVRDTLEGRVKLEDLSAVEQDAVFSQMGAWFDNPPDDVKAAYAEIGSRPDAVGLDEKGKLVRVRAGPRLRSVR